MTSREATHRWITVGLLAGIFAGLGATQAEAQRWGRPDVPQAGACFYRDANFRGDYFCVRAGDAIDSLPNSMNDQISSIRTFGRGVEVTVFQNRRFGGRSQRFGEVRNLRDDGWNDKLSSLRVEDSSRGGFGRNRDRDRDRDRVRISSGDAERIVRRAYQDILDRDPDDRGLRLYRSHIIDDNWSEQQVREALRDSPEYRNRVREGRGR